MTKLDPHQGMWWNDEDVPSRLPKITWAQAHIAPLAACGNGCGCGKYECALIDAYEEGFHHP